MSASMPIRRARFAVLATAVITAAACGGAASRAGASEAIQYRTVFQDPGPVPGPDLRIEDHTVALIDATPSGERIHCALRDFNRQRVADALIRAHRRGVDVQCVIDGDERVRPIVQALQVELGPDRFFFCGAPTFDLHSCIASRGVIPESPKSLQHNKFFAFSKLEDGRERVVLQMSMNFLEPTQLNYYNDMVEIAGDHRLYDAYVQYATDMKAQLRTDNRYDTHTRSGDDGRNTIFPSPRAQASLDVDDTIVDRMNEIDCSDGGTIRAANMAFRSARAVIMRKLVALGREGCDIDVVFSNADGDIVAGLVAGGVRIHPLLLRALPATATSPARPQVLVHPKFWLVDARSKETGEPQKLVYAGSSNWRADQQYSDDLLLRIADDDVHAQYSEYWELIKSRATSDLTRRLTESVRPAVAIGAPHPEQWNNSDVTVRVAASDGHLLNVSGLDRLRIEMTGAQTGSWELLGEANGYKAQTVVVSAEGTTRVTAWATDKAGNTSAVASSDVRIDKTEPIVLGLPTGCELWPPNGQMVHVADVSADDALSDVASLDVSASSDAVSDDGDVAISDGAVDLRAQKGAEGTERTYTIEATATDLAGNAGTASAECVVPHSQRG